MTARLSFASAVEKAFIVIAFLPVVLMVYPEPAAAAFAAQNPGEKALVFQVNSKTQTETTQIVTGLSYNEIVQNDILVSKLQDYLTKHNSPLAPFAGEIVQQPQWQRALAISFVESNFGIHCHSNNCSGIGGAPGQKSWRVYSDKLAWFKDMAQLLEKPIYKERYTSCISMNGVYNAGSRNWLRGCIQKSNELLALTEQANAEKIALANQPTASTATAEIALVK